MSSVCSYCLKEHYIIKEDQRLTLKGLWLYYNYSGLRDYFEEKWWQHYNNFRSTCFLGQ
jgi:hypothetical protein